MIHIQFRENRKMKVLIVSFLFYLVLTTFRQVSMQVIDVPPHTTGKNAPKMYDIFCVRINEP